MLKENNCSKAFFKQDIRLLDVKNKFKYVNLDVELFMEPPEGLEEYIDTNGKENGVELI